MKQKDNATMMLWLIAAFIGGAFVMGLVFLSYHGRLQSSATQAGMVLSE